MPSAATASQTDMLATWRPLWHWGGSAVYTCLLLSCTCCGLLTQRLQQQLLLAHVCVKIHADMSQQQLRLEPLVSNHSSCSSADGKCFSSASSLPSSIAHSWHSKPATYFPDELHLYRLDTCCKTTQQAGQ